MSPFLKKIAKANEENISNEVIHALCKAAACTSEAYTRLKRISLEVDSEDSEDEDIEDGGTDSEDSEDEDIEDGGTDSEGMIVVWFQVVYYIHFQNW